MKKKSPKRPPFRKSLTCTKLRIETGRKYSAPDTRLGRRLSIISDFSDPPTPDEEVFQDFSRVVKKPLSPLHTPRSPNEMKSRMSSSFRGRKKDHFSVRSSMRRGRRKTLSTVFQEDIPRTNTIFSFSEEDDFDIGDLEVLNCDFEVSKIIFELINYPFFSDQNKEKVFLESFYGKSLKKERLFVLGSLVNYIIYFVLSLLTQSSRFWEPSSVVFMMICCGIFFIHPLLLYMLFRKKVIQDKHRVDRTLLIILSVSTFLEVLSAIFLEVHCLPLTLSRLVYRSLFLRARFHVHFSVSGIHTMILFLFPFSADSVLILFFSVVVLFKKFKMEQFLRSIFEISATHKLMIQKCEESYQKHHEILCNIIPARLVRKCRRNSLEGKKQLVSEYYHQSAVISLDIQGFTHFSRHIHPKYLITLLNIVYSKFDEIARRYQIEKVKTIGDEYIVCEWDTTNAFRSICFGIDAMNWFKEYASNRMVNLVLRGGLGWGSLAGFCYGKENSISFDVLGQASDEAENNQQKSRDHLLCISSKELVRRNREQIVFLETRLQKQTRTSIFGDCNGNFEELVGVCSSEEDENVVLSSNDFSFFASKVSFSQVHRKLSGCSIPDSNPTSSSRRSSFESVLSERLGNTERRASHQIADTSPIASRRNSTSRRMSIIGSGSSFLNKLFKCIKKNLFENDVIFTRKIFERIAFSIVDLFFFDLSTRTVGFVVYERR